MATVISLGIFVVVVIIAQVLLYEKYLFKNLDYDCAFSAHEAYEGDEIFLIEISRNRKILPIPWLKVNITTSRWLDFAVSKSAVAQDSRYVTSGFFLSGFQKITRRWYLKCLKRGFYTIEYVTIIAGDLLGLYSNSMPVRVNANLIVYPGTVNLEQNLISANSLQGDTIVKRWINEDPFMVCGAREYTTQDPMSKVHWQATAKIGQLMVKKNEFTMQFNLSIFLNIQSLENEWTEVVEKDTIEIGIKVVSTLLDRALREGIAVRFGANAGTVENRGKEIFTDASNGRQHIYEILKLLAKLELKKVRDFSYYLNDKMAFIMNSQVIIVTAYINDSICECVRQLEFQGNKVKLILLNRIPLEQVPNDLDIYFMHYPDRIKMEEDAVAR